jgi:hypothetical protein
VKFQTEIAQTSALQVVMDDIKRGFFSETKSTVFLRNRRGDDIANRLRLAGSRRTFDDGVSSFDDF